MTGQKIKNPNSGKIAGADGTCIELPVNMEDVRQGEKRQPKLSDIVIFRHPKSKDSNPDLLESPAIITEVIERGREYDISICVLSATIGLGFRAKVLQGMKAGEWHWPE